MAITINVNGVSVSYPQTRDLGWADDATDFAVQSSAAFAKLGLSTGTTVDLPGTLDVTGATTLDSTLLVKGNTTLGDGSGDTVTTTGNVSVGGTLSVTGATSLSSTLSVTSNLTVDGNTTLGNASADSITINASTLSTPNNLNIDSNLLFIDAVNNRLGVNKNNPSVALDVVGGITATGTISGSIDASSISSGKLSSSRMSSGSIIQVVSTTKSDTFSTTSSTFVDLTGLSASITPISTSSKILVLVSVSRGVSIDAISRFRLDRNGTSIAIGDTAGSRTRASIAMYFGSSATTFQIDTAHLSFLDSPSSTSSLTYKVQCATDGTGTLYINRNSADADSSASNRTISTITLLEIAG